MKKIFLFLFFIIVTNIQINAMETIGSPKELPHGITINEHYFDAQTIKVIIKSCIEQDESLAEEKHRGSLCLYTINILKENVYKRLSKELRNENQIEKIRNKKLQSPRSFLGSIEKEVMDKGNIIFDFILAVLNEKDEELKKER